MLCGLQTDRRRDEGGGMLCGLPGATNTHGNTCCVDPTGSAPPLSGTDSSTPSVPRTRSSGPGDSRTCP